MSLSRPSRLAPKLVLCLIASLAVFGESATNATPPATKPQAVGPRRTSAMVRNRENWRPTQSGKLAAPLKESPQNTATLPDLKATDPIINVNGDLLLWGSMKHHAEMMIANFTLPAGVTMADFEAERNNIMLKNIMKIAEHFITKTVLAQEAKKHGLALTSDEVEAKKNKLFETLANNPKSLESFRKELATPGSFVSLDLANTLLAEKLTRDVIRPRIRISEDEITQYIAGRNKKNAEIAVYNNGLRPKIEGLLKKIKTGAGFAEIAKEESECDSSENGGEWGTFKREDIREEIAAVAFKMQENSLSDIIETPYSYHIVKLLKRNQPFLQVEGATNNVPDVSVKIAHIMLEKKNPLPALDRESARTEMVSIREKEEVARLKAALIKSAKIETPLPLY